MNVNVCHVDHSFVTFLPAATVIRMATQDQEVYLAILKASYDYEPQSEDEIAIKADQLLLLIERVDEEWVRSSLIC